MVGGRTSWSRGKWRKGLRRVVVKGKDGHESEVCFGFGMYCCDCTSTMLQISSTCGGKDYIDASSGEVGQIVSIDNQKQIESIVI